MTTPAEMVREFHEAFGLPAPAEPVDYVPTYINAFRRKLHDEEDRELRAAADGHSVSALVKEACDLAYVAIGTCVSLGVDFDRAFAEVHRSNMSKLGPNGRPIRRADGKVLKGPDYRPADLSRVSRRAT